MAEPTTTVDSITVEVIRHRLLSASQEMMRNLQRTAHSTIVYEIRDFGLGIYDPKGALLAEAPGLAIFTRANDYSLEKVIEFLGVENIEPGDCILLNYPYWSSAHTLDVAAFSPIHHDGELLGFTATRIHWLDLKQKDAGYVLDSTDMHQEGIFFPCTKIEKRGVIQEDIVNLIKFNSRYPEQTVGDMRAQIAACRTGERRVKEIVERFGKDVFKQACKEIQDHGERLARAGLAKLPKGTWTAHDFVDDDGIDERLVRMECTVTISDDEMLVDWSASDPQVKGPINLPYGMTLALSSLIFKALTTPETPATAGNFRPLRVIAPEGNLMHASAPAPTFTLWTGLLAGEVITKALAQGMPDLVPACSGGDVCSMMGLGLDPRTGRYWLEATNEAVGFGGHVGGDGESGIMHLSEPGCRNNPVEVLEVKSPMLIEHYGLRPDSGGPGEHRGGLGVSRIYRFTAPSTAITLVKKTRTRPWGMEGGETGDNCHVILRPGTDAEKVTGGVYEAMGADEVLVNNSGGGGGWGDPFRRTTAAVLDDVREGYVSAPRAAKDYGVVIDTTAMAVDEAATAALRASRGASARS
jgi:N-methylhydantoinase B